MAHKPKQQRIGKLTMTTLASETEETYSDGQIEHDLLALFKKKNPDVKKFIKDHPSWATTYHLSPVRENLLNWLDINPKARVLEVGAGCGALTGILAQKAGHVTALELSKDRANVNAHRHKDKPNVEVIVGNLQDLSSYTDEKYDVVVCIGVLEYAGRFIDAKDPFHAFAARLKKFTKPTGFLALAIENKLGVKYLSGAKEDHVRRYLEGVEDYPHYDGVRTFGKWELTALLNEVGFSQTNFHYPFPDYKMPSSVFSDDYLPGIHTQNLPYALFPTPNPDQPRQQVFREQLAVRSFAKNRLFGDLANSFLIIASENGNTSQPMYARGSSSRKPEFAISTQITNVGTKRTAIKKPLSPLSEKHLDSMLKNHLVLNKSVANSLAHVCRPKKIKDGVAFEYIDGISIDEKLTDFLQSKQHQAFLRTIDDFIAIVDGFTKEARNKSGFSKLFGNTFDSAEKWLYPGIVDLNFDNIIISAKDETPTLIDYEWCFDFSIPRDFVIVRSLYYFFWRRSQFVRATASPENPVIELCEDVFVPTFLYDNLKEYFDQLQAFLKAEDRFQDYVTGRTYKVVVHRDPVVYSTELPDNLADSYEHIQNVNKSFQDTINAQQEIIDNLSNQLSHIKNSKVWKTLSKGRSALRRLGVK